MDHEGLVVEVVVVARELPVEDALEERPLELGVGLPQGADRPRPLLELDRLVAPRDDVLLGLPRSAVFARCVKPISVKITGWSPSPWRARKSAIPPSTRRQPSTRSG